MTALKNLLYHFLKMYGGYLPSSNARWCTKKLKLEPFEKYVGDDPVISYVGIRGMKIGRDIFQLRKTYNRYFLLGKIFGVKDVVTKLLSNSKY